MCLVISVLLSIMAINFYLNGFIAPAISTGLLAIAFIVFLIRNVRCKSGSCTPKFKKEDKDDN